VSPLPVPHGLVRDDDLVVPGKVMAIDVHEKEEAPGRE
jgi:hypothetical protein